MKRIFRALAIFTALSLAATFAFAQPADIKSQVQIKNPAITKPQTNIKKLPKSSVIPNTGHESGGETAETQPETPQGRADVRIQNVQFMPVSSSFPSCLRRYVVSLSNIGTAPSNPNLTLKVIYRVSDNDPGTNSQTLDLESIAPGETYSVGAGVINRYKGETSAVFAVMENNFALMSAAYPLPAAENISADNIVLGDVVFSTSQMSIVIQNTGSIPVNPIMCSIRGIVNDSGGSDRIIEQTVDCIPAGDSRTLTIPIPANPYQSYLVRLSNMGLAQIIAERTYPRP